MTDGLRLAVSLLSVLPAGRVHDVSRRTAGRAMLWTPGVGLLLGAVAATVMALSERAGYPALLSGTLAVGTLAVLTRGLHLDGIADTADGLGSRRPAPGALDVMRSGDIGPFGVVTLVFVLLAQATALSAAGPMSLLVAVPVGRVAVVAACRAGVPAARADGLGALVGGTTKAWQVVGLALVVGAGALALGWRGPVAVVVGLAAAELLLRHCRRRFGGVTGDVLGAVTETATTTCLLVLATG